MHFFFLNFDIYLSNLAGWEEGRGRWKGFLKDSFVLDIVLNTLPMLLYFNLKMTNSLSGLTVEL